MGLSAGNWRPLTPSGGDENNRPGPRFSAATAVDPAADALYMYGGQDSSQAFLSELWKLELDTAGVAQARWTRLRTPRLHTPPPRGAASLTLLGGQYLLVRFGWLMLSGMVERRVGAWRDDIPAVFIHVFILPPPNPQNPRNQQLYGGFGRDGARNDAWLLDLAHSKSQGWQRLAVKGGAGDDAPPHRWHHTVVAVGGRTVVVVGGSDEAGTDAGDAWTLEVDVRAGTAVWAPQVDAAAGGGIPPRHGHAALRTAATAGVASFVVFGGVNTTADTLPASFLGDAYRLDVAAGKWAPVEGGDAEKGAGGPGARAYAAVGHGAGHSVVFGGFAGYTGDVDDRLLGDVWVFRHGGVQGGLEEGVGAEVVASE